MKLKNYYQEKEKIMEQEKKALILGALNCWISILSYNPANPKLIKLRIVRDEVNKELEWMVKNAS